MVLVKRLKRPSFDLAWLSLPSYDDEFGECNNDWNENYLLIPGGGGGTKSGVTNEIQVLHYIKNQKADDIEFCESFKTDQKLCSNISTWRVAGSAYLCASLDDTCWVLSAKKNDSGGDIQFNKMVEFKADFADTEGSSVNCTAMMGSQSFSSLFSVITGGEDGTLRVWDIIKVDDDDDDDVRQAEEGEEGSDSPVFQEVKRAELTGGHSGPIMSLTVGSWKYRSTPPATPAVGSGDGDGDGGVATIELACTASRDGTVIVWDAVHWRILTKILPQPVAATAPKPTSKRGSTTSTSTKLECRGAVFSANGQYLYYLQSERRGATSLVKMELFLIENKDSASTSTPSKGDSEETHKNLPNYELKSEFRKMVVACSVPATRLRTNLFLRGEHPPLLAVGASDGSVSVFRQDSLQRIKVVAGIHDLPVTGLGFLPPVISTLPTNAHSWQYFREENKEWKEKKEEKRSGHLPPPDSNPCLLVSCSADYRVILVPLSSRSFFTAQRIRVFWSIFSFVLISVLAWGSLFFAALDEVVVGTAWLEQISHDILDSIRQLWL